MSTNNSLNNNLGVLTTKGDLLGSTGSNTNVRVAVGIDGTVLTADSTVPNGVSYKPAASSGGWTRTFLLMGS